ncbi:MAG TPA: MlaD family protein, partial [Candidatus Omnitrophota bacterium]|nr:MlaD family protein [Candidatus Omnitrophota bacterium]
MFRDEKLELKVGLFIGIGIFIMFLIVFTVQDFSMLGKWYDIKVVFSYVNGLTENSPVRYAGVGIGEVRDIEMFFDEESQMTRVRVHARIKGDVKIEDDALPRINSLGLLG